MMQQAVVPQGAAEIFKRLALISNALDPPPDEGIKRSAHELAGVFSKHGSLVHTIAADAPVLARKLLVDPQLVRDLRRRRVKGVIYVPTQSATPATLLRAKLLAVTANVHVAVVALQPRELPPWSDRVPRRLIAPSLLVTSSPTVLAEARRRQWRARLIPMGVDHERFTPVSPARQRALRLRHGIAVDRPVVLHVGHARTRRGLDWLANLGDGIERVAVVGASLGSDVDIVQTLRARGVRVIDTYLSGIEELYQLADVYVFPVRDERAAVGAPLSVFEAMACNLPVVTTRFGALEDIFAEGGGFVFADDFRTFCVRVHEALESSQDHVWTREQVRPFAWRSLGYTVAGMVGEVCGIS